MSKYNYHLTGQNSDFAKIMAKSPTISPTVNGVITMRVRGRGVTCCRSKVRMRSDIEYVLPIHGVLLKFGEPCSIQPLRSSFLHLCYPCSFSFLGLCQRCIGSHWLAWLSLNIARMLGSILGSCGHQTSWVRYGRGVVKDEVSSNLDVALAQYGTEQMCEQDLINFDIAPKHTSTIILLSTWL